MFSSRAWEQKFSQRLWSFSFGGWIFTIFKLNFKRRSIIFPSVPLIWRLEFGDHFSCDGKSHLVSLVPENPTDFLVSARSHEDEVIVELCWRKSLGKTYLFSQNAIVALQNLNISKSCLNSLNESMLILFTSASTIFFC